MLLILVYKTHWHKLSRKKVMSSHSWKKFKKGYKALFCQTWSHYIHPKKKNLFNSHRINNYIDQLYHRDEAYEMDQQG